MSSGKLPEEWVKSELDNVLLTIIGGGTPSKAIPEYYQGDIPWMSVKDMNKHALTDTVDHITHDAVENSSTNIIPAGTPIIATRMSLGKIVTASFDSAINQDLKALFLSSRVDRNFFIHWYRSQAQLIESLGTGTTVKGIRLEVLKALSINLPPLAEQKVLAEKLDTLLAQVDSTKARLEQIPQILKRFRQAVLTMAVRGDLTKNWRDKNNILANSWANQKASDICTKVQSGSTPTDNPFEQNGKIPFLKVYNIVNQKIDFDYKPQFITDEVHRSKSKRSIAFPDDVLMNIVGPPLGKIAILTDQYPEWNLNQAITLFRVEKEKMLSKFLYYVLCEGKLVRDVMHDTKGIVGQINISLTQCREAVIPCPSLSEQQEIVRRVEQLFAYADTIEKQVNNALARVNNLTQSIQAKAFRGELSAQWRAENPDLISGENSAAALLEKIKAERAASGSKKSSRKKA
ncbi:type I restriction enzyme S subunit [Pantoea allii]|uniref:Type I restriction enzyme S subunit n=1 Tax=Pantoea allii TaxID=574096 RepID=A0A2V2BQP9_9GAMM|nr:restriction endonuclease subunit S [Pantoea allii]PWK99439.1 type I restriction enzyme S subunit [Pantoea allii]